VELRFQSGGFFVYYTFVWHGVLGAGATGLKRAKSRQIELTNGLRTAATTRHDLDTRHADVNGDATIDKSLVKLGHERLAGASVQARLWLKHIKAIAPLEACTSPSAFARG
jgi:hypothetical protein